MVTLVLRAWDKAAAQDQAVMIVEAVSAALDGSPAAPLSVCEFVPHN